ncbi:hypothetical protein GCM10023145_23560 [Angustibacter luteus]
MDGSGKTTLGDALEVELARRGHDVTRVRADNFLNPPEVRYRLGRHSPQGFFRDSYDLDSLRRTALEPTRGALVLDGLFLHRAELADLWHLSVFLDVPFAETFRRMAVRDGCDPDPEHPANARYVGGQRLYLAACDPRSQADVVLTLSELQGR